MTKREEAKLIKGALRTDERRKLDVQMSKRITKLVDAARRQHTLSDMGADYQAQPAYVCRRCNCRTRKHGEAPCCVMCGQPMEAA